MKWQQLGNDTAGVWTRTQALEVVSRHVVARELQEGTWQMLLPGTYTDGGHEPDARQWAHAAVLCTGGAGQPFATGGRHPGPWLKAVACGRTAARVWGLPLVDDDDPATGAHEQTIHHVHSRTGLTAVHGRDGHAVVRHRLDLRPGDVRRLSDGLRLTSPVRTAYDCAGLLKGEAVVCLLDDGLRRGLFDRDELEAQAARMAGRPGVVAFRAAVALADGRAEAPSETLARLLLQPVLPRLQPQVRLRTPSGSVVARFDLADELARFAVDVDGRRGHAGPQMVARDRRRDRRTEAQGWHTERAIWYELRRQQPELVRRVLGRYRWWTTRSEPDHQPPPP
jgi:hypothetical protein